MDISDIIEKAKAHYKDRESVMEKKAAIKREIERLQKEYDSIENPDFAFVPQWEIELMNRVRAAADPTANA
jgi:hypothetical protein